MDYLNQSFGTGSHDFEEYKEIIFPFGKYEITIKLSPTNEFVGVTAIKVNKDFLSHSQKVSALSSWDVDEYYKDEK
jgi:hypothetical protein